MAATVLLVSIAAKDTTAPLDYICYSIAIEVTMEDQMAALSAKWALIQLYLLVNARKLIF